MLCHFYKQTQYIYSLNILGKTDHLAVVELVCSNWTIRLYEKAKRHRAKRVLCEVAR